jgi:exopolyphosphatase/pppGpp-phosphohydrolase
MLSLYKHIDEPSHKALLLQVEVISIQLLRFAHRNAQDFTLHDEIHSRDIIRYFNELLDKIPHNLTKDEILLLYLAAWTHDFGMVVNRDQHNQFSRNIINDSVILKETINNSLFLGCLKSMALSHSFSFDITDISELRGNIRLRLICSVLRVIDSIDVTRLRISKEVFNAIQKSIYPMEETSKKFWESHMSIKGIDIHQNEIEIFITDAKAELLVSKLKEELAIVRHILGYDFPIPEVKTTIFSE